MLFWLVIIGLNISICTCYNATEPIGSVPGDDEISKAWESFKSKFNLSFNETIDSQRFQIFRQNYVRVWEHNHNFAQNLSTFSMELNRFSIWTQMEYLNRSLGYRNSSRENHTRTYQYSIGRMMTSSGGYNTQIPSSADYRAYTTVRNQLGCGACWAFVIVGQVESIYNMRYRTSVGFSVQQLLDCTINSDYRYQTYGCEGGTLDNGYEYVKNVGLIFEQSYPSYSQKPKYCYQNSYPQKTRVRAYYDIPEGNEGYLQYIIGSYGPVAAGIDASSAGFVNYQDGIYIDTLCSPQNLNHAVLIVGYGTENGVDYWWIKNSWGPDWGIGGYMKFARNRNNMCGIASVAAYAYL